MFKVRISDLSRQQLQSFIFSYKRLFLNLYSDTGIYDEKLIRDTYIQSSKRIDFRIRNRAQKLLQDTTVFGRQERSDGVYEVSYSIGNFLVILQYTESKKLLEREIINITFYKK